MKKPGFTIIESAIAIVVAGLAISSLLLVFITSVDKSVRQEALAAAIALAKTKMEIVSSLDFAVIEDEPLTVFDNNFSAYLSQVTVDFVSSESLVQTWPAPTAYKRIKVEITTGLLPGVTTEIVSLATDAVN